MNNFTEVMFTAACASVVFCSIAVSAWCASVLNKLERIADALEVPDLDEPVEQTAAE